MYLLDNYKKNVSKETINKINDLNNYEDLVKESTIDSNYGITNYFNKIESYLKFSSKVSNTKTTLENIKNLFLGEPLNLNPNDSDYLLMMTKLDSEFKYSGIKNSLHSFNKKHNFMEVYKSKFMTMLEENKELSSYDIVGKTTKSFSKLFYGSKIVDKSDMDKFLFNVEMKNDIKTEKQINKDDFINKTKHLCKELNVEFVENMDSNIKNLSDKLTEYDKNLIKNKNSKFFINEKLIVNKKLKSSVFKIINTTLSNQENEYLINNNIDYDFKNFDKMKSFTVLDVMDRFNNFDRYISYEDSPIYYSIKNKIEYIQKEVVKVFNELSKEYTQKISALYIKEQNSLNTNLFSLGSQKDFFNNDFEEYQVYLNKFQEINELFTQSKSLEYSRYILNKLIYTETNAYDPYNNNWNGLVNFNKKENNEFKDYLKEILNNIKNNEEYSINEIKQFLYIVLSNNKTIYDLYKNTDFLKNVESNKFIKNLLDNKFEFNVEHFDVKRLKYINDILVYNKDIETLFQSDISIEIKDTFYKKLNLSTNSKEGEDQLNKLLLIFNNKTNDLNFKNNNTLLLMILESYENGNFKEKNFDVLLDIFKKPLNKINNSDKEIINGIEDNWLKWSILTGREVKDKNLVNSSINPLDFEFNKMNTLKKIIADIKPIDSISKYDYNFFQLIIKYVPNFEDKVIDLFKDYNKYMNDSKYKNYIYMFNRCLENVIKEDNYLINNKLTQLLERNNLNFNDLVNEVKQLSKFVNIIKEPNFESFNVSYNQLYTILNGKGDLINTILNIKDKDLFQQLIFNIDSIPKITDKKLLSYIDYYNKMSKTDSFINFKKDDCLIPLIEKKFDNGYSYKVKTIKDFDILLTGEKTNCCMTLGNAGWNIYKHMYQYPKENVIFEVYKNDKPIANSWTWINENQICFDNIEVLGGELRESVIDCYKDAALRFIVESKHIDIVNFGTPHTDVDVNLLGNKLIDNNFRNFNYMNVYTDSYKQMCIATTNPFLTNVNDMLSKFEQSKKIDENQLNILKESVSKNLLDNSLNIRLNNNNKIGATQNQQGILFPTIMDFDF